MGREVRKVPEGWEHPRDARGRYVPLYGGNFSKALKDYRLGKKKWEQGFREDWSPEGSEWVPIEPKYQMTWEEWQGGPEPVAEDYMPEWPESECTHLVMYENTSEGTPISPAFKTPEELARWLADTGASSFGSCTATYEQWLATIRRGFAVSAMVTFSDSGNHLKSGVAAMGDLDK